MENLNIYKVILVGDSMVGKTTFIKKCIYGIFEEDYIPTMGVEIRSLIFSTNYRNILFKVWDISGQKRFHFLRDNYYFQANCAIIMYDVNEKKDIDILYENIRKICGDIPTIICGNKNDLIENNKLITKDEDNIIYYNISVKKGDNFDELFFNLVRILENNPGLNFV